MVSTLLIVLGLICGVFFIFFLKDYIQNKNNLENNSWGKVSFIGFITNFLDALGIGSFATGAALLRILNQCSDKLIPGTLNVGYTIPVMLEAFIFIKVIKVDIKTLVVMIVSAIIGAWIGAGIVSKLPEKKVQKIMGTALIITSLFMIASQIGFIPSGGKEIGLKGGKLVIAAVGNFILGALMTAGIGLYAPCMVLVYFLGLSPKIAFPIMFGSSAFLMPIASIKFIKEGAYNRKAAMAFSTVGILGVIVAVTLVKSLPMDIMSWLVIAVVIYTGVSMLKSARKELEEDHEELKATAN